MTLAPSLLVDPTPDRPHDDCPHDDYEYAIAQFVVRELHRLDALPGDRVYVEGPEVDEPLALLIEHEMMREGFHFIDVHFQAAAEFHLGLTRRLR